MDDIEHFVLKPTPFVPNSPLPVVIYRNVLPHPRTEETVTEFLTRHNAWQKGGTWGHEPRRHYHPNSHECYGIFSGGSRMRLGVGQLDDTLGHEIDVHTGDVVVVPAGTAHSCASSTDDYRYIGVYPTHAPQWRNEYGDGPLDLELIRREIHNVEFPLADPVTGEQDILINLWRQNPAKAY